MSPSRGEVWLVNLDPTVGDEIRKVRPAVVVSRDAIGILALRVVLPIIGWQDRFAAFGWLARLDPDASNGLEKTSAADAFQVRSIATRRFVPRIGALGAQDMAGIGAALRIILEA